MAISLFSPCRRAIHGTANPFFLNAGSDGVPLYFFHLRDGEDLLRDLDGTELADEQAVRSLALKFARMLIGVGAMEGGVPLHLALEVHDEEGNVCVDLPFKDAVELIHAESPAEQAAITLGSLQSRFRRH